MNRIHLTMLFFSFLFTTCQKGSIDAPDAIKEIIRSAEKTCDPNCPSYVHEYRWKNNIIYVRSCAGPACLCIALLYDSTGTRITPPQGSNEYDIIRESDFIREVWTCPKKQR